MSSIMNVSFTDLMESLLTIQRLASEVTAAGVSVRKEDRGSLSNSNKLKLSKSAREEGLNKFTFFVSGGKLVNDF